MIVPSDRFNLQNGLVPMHHLLRRLMWLSLQSEAALVYLIGCLAILLRNSLVHGLWTGGRVRKWRLFGLDFGCIVVPMFLAQTFFADHLLLTAVVLCALCAIAFMHCGARVGVTPLRALRPLRIDSARALRDSHTMFRALLLICTALAILAVDFHQFPRRFAKTQYYGQSLMDTGTAAFVFVNALADHDASARGQSPRQRAARATMQIFWVRVPTLLLLFLTGVGRSVFIRLSGYGQDVTEYGVHWNFFLTLFFLRLFVVIVPTALLIPVGLLLGLGYQLALKFAGLEQWILREDHIHPRQGFIDQNREGLFSLAGYCFTYALSLAYAKCSAHILQRDRRLSMWGVVCCLGLSLLCFCVQLFLEVHFGLLASRRLANTSYSLAMLALCSATTSLLQLTQIVTPLPQAQVGKGGLVEAISHNALLHFLLANVLTGCTNMLMPVLRIHGALQETAAQLCYALATSVLIFLFHLNRKQRSPPTTMN